MTLEELIAENESLRGELSEATQNLDAIRTGQIDALVVKGDTGHQLYTLKTADQTYRVFIEKMSEGAITLNHHGLILYSNSKFAAMVDMPLSKVIGLPFCQLIHQSNHPELERLLTASWEQDLKAELSVIDSKNNLTPCLLSFTALELDEGFSLSIIITDLTRQKEIETILKSNNEKLAEINKELERSNMDLQQFAYVASHDLQEPLRKILLFSDRMMTRHTDELSEVVFKHFEKIWLSSQRMQTLILDILSYSRLSTDILERTHTDLNKVIKEILDDYELLIHEKRASVTVAPLPTIEVNRGQIRQVFQNILSNALKFSRAETPPVVSISCEVRSLSKESTSPKEAYYSIIFSDNGIGFEIDQYEKIFTLFHRLHSKDKYNGTGIGLAIAKRIVDKHKGFLLVNSEVGVGSQFFVNLPVNQRRT